ncbi:FIGNL1-interacting regulator of recombination and mitosis-like [Planococcus citri]|uniref:FIGNL1-interacting regulator of recombination and mitosis-like n=1 Tax=Planococcus citri TaxID=170843 RepID=UPI0031F90379
MSSQIVCTVSDLSLLPDVEFELAFKQSAFDLVSNFRIGTGDTRVLSITTFERFFRLVKVLDNSADGDIIQNAVSALVSEFSKNLSQAEAENIEVLKCRLQENVRILASLIVLVNTLSSIPNLNVETIISVPKDTISVLLSGFEYCRKSSTSVNLLNDQITQLFKTCYTFLRDYFVFINKLRINCQYESEFNLLTEIVDKMYEIGAIVITLDLKTMAELWKGYTQVLKTYSAHLRNEFDISKIIRFLIRHITERITSLDNSSDDKIMTLTLKVCVFLLKIMVKLCEYFEQCFADCSGELFEFALFLHKYSRFLCEFSKLDVDLASKIDTHLVPGVDPLLNILITDRQFAKYYLNYNLCDKTSWDKSAFLLLSSLMFRKLMVCSDEAISIWINDTESSIIHRTFKMIRDCDKELYCDIKVPLSCSDALLSQEVTIFEALLVNFASLIINEISNEKFPIVENLLVENLLNSTPSVALFVSDLWCILARYGSSELCYEHVRFLISVCNEIPEGDVRVFVKSLLGRLFGFLSLNHQLQVISELPRDENFLNCYNRLGTKFRDQVCQKTVADVANKFKHVQTNLRHKFEGESYTKMIHLVNLLCTLESAYWKDYASFAVEFVIQTWKRLRSPLLAEMTSKDFLSVFASLFHLSRITCILIPHLGCSQVLEILRSIRYLTDNQSLRVQLCCLKILQGLQNRQIDSNFDEITNNIADCFNRGIKNEHPVIQQFYLDGFTRFSHVTNYEIIISLTVSKNKLVSERVAQYLQKNPYPVSEKQTFHRFLSILVEKSLKMKVVESNGIDFNTDDGEIISAKRIKLEDDLDDTIVQVENLLDKVFESVRNKRINQRQKQAVVKMLQNLEKWKNYV